jgi:hypothetical protein
MSPFAFERPRADISPESPPELAFQKTDGQNATVEPPPSPRAGTLS